jgi:hypothetical protein
MPCHQLVGHNWDVKIDNYYLKYVRRYKYMSEIRNKLRFD